MCNATTLYETLLAYYGTPPWWSDNPFEVIVGAVLVQNTAWGNVQKAIANFGGNLQPAYVDGIETGELERLIRPCGFYTAKAACLKAVTCWYERYGYSPDAVKKKPKDTIRAELLAIKGIGPETADVILLYSFYYPVFVIDAYTKRLAERLQLPVPLESNALKRYFEENLKRDAVLYGQYHWLILTHAIRHCKKKPNCTGCPFFGMCRYQP